MGLCILVYDDHTSNQPRLGAIDGVASVFAVLSLTPSNSAFVVVTSICIQNYQRDALNIIYSSNITLLYMFRASSTHLQEDTVVHEQHMVPSLSIRVLVSC